MIEAPARESRGVESLSSFLLSLHTGAVPYGYIRAGLHCHSEQLCCICTGPLLFPLSPEARKGRLSMGRGEGFYSVLERVSGKWWFLLVLLLLFFVPIYSGVTIDPREIPEVTVAVLSNAFIYSFSYLFPPFKIIPIVIVILLAVIKNRSVRAFDIYTAALSFGFAFFQTAASTEKYGFAVLSGNLIVYTIVLFFWVVEAVIKKNEIVDETRPLWRYWVVPFAFLSFWYPIDLTTLEPDFSVLRILDSASGLTYCMMTPVFLAVVTVFCKRFNRAAVRVTAFAGAVTGIFNIAQMFLKPFFLWMGVLHIPLFVVSVYAFVLSYTAEG